MHVNVVIHISFVSGFGLATEYAFVAVWIRYEILFLLCLSLQTFIHEYLVECTFGPCEIVIVIAAYLSCIQEMESIRAELFRLFTAAKLQNIEFQLISRSGGFTWICQHSSQASPSS